VDLNQVAIYEQMGTCFGRLAGKPSPRFEKISGVVGRHL